MPGIFDIFKSKEERKILCEYCKKPIENHSNLLVFPTLGSLLIIGNVTMEKVRGDKVPFHKTCFADVEAKTERHAVITTYGNKPLFPISATSISYSILLLVSLGLSALALLHPSNLLDLLFSVLVFFVVFLPLFLQKLNIFYDLELPLLMGLKETA